MITVWILLDMCQSEIYLHLLLCSFCFLLNNARNTSESYQHDLHFFTCVYIFSETQCMAAFLHLSIRLQRVSHVETVRFMLYNVRSILYEQWTWNIKMLFNYMIYDLSYYMMELLLQNLMKPKSANKTHLLSTFNGK